ncbi:VCBS repeat-containing protein [uncultured Thiodictyon sp.]|uniref:FG-GAP repeat domain-containing protein n=1 Tax=uncultured Thiodictyon sp. TaxID=1846217 RepID=UPI0026001E58|nr:VCBS repeat-containing protein [uncultured Thiodictyon sp.]
MSALLGVPGLASATGPGYGGLVGTNLTGVSGTPLAAATGVFTTSGFPDLVNVRNTTNQVSVRLGNGNGTFGGASLYTTGAGPYAVVTGRLRTVNTNVDIVTVNRTANTIDVLLGNGDGTFAAPVPYANNGATSAPVALALGDVTGEGNVDIVVANGGTPGTVSIFLGNGDGTFVPPDATHVVATGAATAPLGVVLTNVFHATPSTVLDIVTADGNANTISVLQNNGAGSFTVASHPSAGAGTPNPVALAAADFNGDGFADIVTANFSNNGIGVLVNNGFGAFPSVTEMPSLGSVPSNPIAVATADLNNDSLLDIAVGNSNKGSGAQTAYGVFNGNGDGTFVGVQNITTQNSTSMSDLVVHDLDGDLKPDVFMVDGVGNRIGVSMNQTQLSLTFIGNTLHITPQARSAVIGGVVTFGKTLKYTIHYTTPDNQANVGWGIWGSGWHALVDPTVPATSRQDPQYLTVDMLATQGNAGKLACMAAGGSTAAYPVLCYRPPGVENWARTPVPPDTLKTRYFRIFALGSVSGWTGPSAAAAWDKP